MRAGVWQRTVWPVWPLLAGLAVMLTAEIPWSILVGVNLKLASSFPWAAPAIAVYLAGYWRYCGGWGWPAGTAAIRHRSFRAGAIPVRSWLWAMAAGVPAVASAVFVLFVWSRLVRLPIPALPDVSAYPHFTILVVALVGGAVSGIAEEAAFRGYIQSAFEERAGPAVAIAITSLLFGLAHFSHSISYALPRSPYYVAIGAIYGVLTWRTGSILPALAIHSIGNALENLLVLTMGAPHTSPLIWQSGPDAAFWRNLGLGIACAAVSGWAFRKLRAVTRPALTGTE
jgi:membrane protease YdiL (CAAX protease family)